VLGTLLLTLKFICHCFSSIFQLSGSCSGQPANKHCISPHILKKPRRHHVLSFLIICVKAEIKAITCKRSSWDIIIYLSGVFVGVAGSWLRGDIFLGEVGDVTSVDDAARLYFYQDQSIGLIEKGLRSQSLRVTTKSELDLCNCSLFKYELNLFGLVVKHCWGDFCWLWVEDV
jgi:hypothetical protein